VSGDGLAGSLLSREAGAFIVHEMDDLKIAQHFSAGLPVVIIPKPAKWATETLMDRLLSSASRTGRRRKSTTIPAMNSWVNFVRPLRGLSFVILIENLL
jgi:hypothetical protein